MQIVRQAPVVNWRAGFAPVAIVVFALVAYHNSFSGPFVFDDEQAIVENSTIRHLWPPDAVLNPPADGSPVSGRPVTNLSFALNYAAGGLGVRGYHFVNLAIHVMASLALYGIVRRTLAPGFRSTGHFAPMPAPTATWVALAAAAAWTVHPLQTESVTYIAQRAESLMGLFYFLTLYSFIRGIEGGRGRRGWLALSIGACGLGMATKEVMVTAPVILFLYDRIFVTGGFVQSWRQRGWFFPSLTATWVLLVSLMIATGDRAGTLGFHTPVSWRDYAAVQLTAIPHYLLLSFWPARLAFDYGVGFGGAPLAPGTGAALLAGLAAATLWALRHRPAAGFVGAWFFVILAPTSSVVPIATEIMAEHRMYLPLAAVAVLVAVGLQNCFGSKGQILLLAAAAGLAVATIRRNEIYRSDATLWRDTVAAVPENYGARNNLGRALIREHDLAGAIQAFEQALAINPHFAGARNNLGAALLQQGKAEEALANLRIAVQAAPSLDYIHANLARALVRAGRPAEAIAEYREALRLAAQPAGTHHELGDALRSVGAVGEAIGEYQAALRIDPHHPGAHLNLANSLAQSGRLAEAIAEYGISLQEDPRQAEVLGNLGGALLQAGRAGEALGYLRSALVLDRSLVEARMNLGIALAALGRPDEAVSCYEEVLQLRPENATAHYNLAVILRNLGRSEEAQTHFSLAQRFRDAAH